MISTVDLPIAIKILDQLSVEACEAILPLLQRDDIDGWLDSTERRRLYWKAKQMNTYNDRDYYNLLKYNPCGLLSYFFNKEQNPAAFTKLTEVLRSIVDHDNNNDAVLLAHIIQQFDNYNYSDEWAELCLSLYEKDVFRGILGYYPCCLRTYFFIHPKRIIERSHDDSFAFYWHFQYDYSLPEKAFDDYSAFIAWCDCIYDAAVGESRFVSFLGAVLGRVPSGKDGIFPHEFVRRVLEKYTNDELTREVAIGWMNVRDARPVAQ